MIPILVNSILNATKRFSLPNRIFTSNFHCINGINNMNLVKTTFLEPNTAAAVPTCGFKVMGKVRRRCKDCVMVRREERLFVLCKTHPRHKQMQIAKDPKNTWILTHATQSKVRPW